MCEEAIKWTAKIWDTKDVPDQHTLFIEGDDDGTLPSHRSSGLVAHTNVEVRNWGIGYERQLFWGHATSGNRVSHHKFGRLDVQMEMSRNAMGRGIFDEFLNGGDRSIVLELHKGML